MTDIEYIAGLRDNRSDIIRDFYRHISPELRTYLGSRYTIPEDVLGDVIQESVVRLWQQIHEGHFHEDKLQSSLVGYLKGVSSRVMMEMYRQYKEVNPEEPDEVVEDMGEVLACYEEDERRKALRELVSKMNAPCAPLLIEFYWYGYAWDEIAHRLNYANADSAKSQKAKCMKKLISLAQSYL